MPKVLVIHNPAANRGEAAKVWPDVYGALHDLHFKFDEVATERPLHASELALQAKRDGYEVVVAMGGDGLTHEVVNGLAHAAGEGEVGTVGIIPVGSGNDFPKMIPLEPNWREAVRRIVQGRMRLFDLGQIVGDIPAQGLPGPHYFMNVMDIGFGALVSFNARTLPTYIKGTTMYLAGVMKTLANYFVPNLTIRLDGETLQQKSTMFAIANGRCFGGAFYIAPDARTDDGLFDLMISDSLGRAAILALIPRVMKGTHTTHPAVKMRLASHVVVESPDPLIVECDGEMPYTEAHRLEISLLPKKLRVIV